jgi:hypothetical protein
MQSMSLTDPLRAPAVSYISFGGMVVKRIEVG